MNADAESEDPEEDSVDDEEENSDDDDDAMKTTPDRDSVSPETVVIQMMCMVLEIGEHIPDRGSFRSEGDLVQIMLMPSYLLAQSSTLLQY